jgi:hypothetical protein
VICVVSDASSKQNSFFWPIPCESCEEYFLDGNDSKKEYEINRESEPERIQQPTIPSETETNGKSLKNIKCDREWTEVHYKRTRKNRTESQGRKKTGEGLMGQKRTWRKELV